MTCPACLAPFTEPALTFCHTLNVVKRKVIEAQVCAACGAVWIARKDGVLRSMGLKDWSRMKQHERRQIQNARGRRV